MQRVPLRSSLCGRLCNTNASPPRPSPPKVHIVAKCTIHVHAYPSAERLDKQQRLQQLHSTSSPRPPCPACLVLPCRGSILRSAFARGSDWIANVSLAAHLNSPDHPPTSPLARTFGLLHGLPNERVESAVGASGLAAWPSACACTAACACASSSRAAPQVLLGRANVSDRCSSSPRRRSSVVGRRAAAAACHHPTPANERQLF